MDDMLGLLFFPRMNWMACSTQFRITAREMIKSPSTFSTCPDTFWDFNTNFDSPKSNVKVMSVLTSNGGTVKLGYLNISSEIQFGYFFFFFDR